MRKLNKIKKKNVFLFLLLLLILFYGVFHSKSYEVEYTLNDVQIKERFDKKEKLYEFHFQTKEKEFFIRIYHKFIQSKQLVNDVEIKEKENTLCIIPKSSKLDIEPLCMQNEEYISFHLIEDEEIIPPFLKKEISYEEKTYKNMTLYALNNAKYYIWNYEGFDIITNKEQKSISLFKEDIYNIPLAIQVGKNIVIADYDSKYAFQKFYVINTQKDKLREIALEKEISYDTYFLGTSSKRAYLVDKKNKVEYEIYPKRLLIENITNNNQGRILTNGEWEAINMNVLASNEMYFTYEENTTFKIEDNQLYKVQGDYKTRISNYNVKEIVSTKEDTVYYLVDEKLYYYNARDGEVLTIRNFEWNFNYKNMIYIV